MNLNDLSKMDLKSIDFSKAIAYLGVHTDALLRMAIVIMTVLGGFNLIEKYLQQTKDFSVQITQMEEKAAQVIAYEKSVSDLRLFWEKAPKPINEDAVVNYVTDLATKNNLEIVSFSPGQVSSDKFSATSKTKFKLRARDYKDFVLFVRSVENSGFALRAEAVSCSLEQGANQGLINIQMEIASIKINEQKNI